MNTIMRDSPLLRILLGGACTIIIVAGMKAIAPLLTTVLLAWLLAYSLVPLPHWLMRKRLPVGLAVLITLLLVVIGGLAIASVLGFSIAGLIQKLPTYQAGLTNIRDEVINFLAAQGIDLAKIRSLEFFSPARLVQFSRSVLAGIGQTLGNVLLLIFLVAVLLFEFAGAQKKKADGKVSQPTLMLRFQEASQDVNRYVAIVGGAGLLQAIANVILLAVLGVDFAVTWGVLFFFLNFIPAFGFILALIPPAIVAFLESGWKIALAVVVGYVVINFVGDNIIKPKFMKKSLDISILLIILSLIFWSWVLGSVGAVLAVPITLAVKNLLQQIASEAPIQPAPIPPGGTKEEIVRG